LPEGIQRIIDRATSRDPAARFPSVRAMGKALLPFASPKAALTWASTFDERPIAPPPARPPVARWLAASFALALLGVAGAVAGALLRVP
jgi:hypothetical protein